MRKSRFINRKKKAIRKVLKNTYLYLIKIKESDFNQFTKQSLSLFAVAQSTNHIDLIRASTQTKGERTIVYPNYKEII